MQRWGTAPFGVCFCLGSFIPAGTCHPHSSVVAWRGSCVSPPLYSFLAKKAAVSCPGEDAGEGRVVLEEGLIAASAQVSVSARGLLVCCLGTTGMPPSPLGWPHVQGAALPTHRYSLPACWLWPGERLRRPWPLAVSVVVGGCSRTCHQVSLSCAF